MHRFMWLTAREFFNRVVMENDMLVSELTGKFVDYFCFQCYDYRDERIVNPSIHEFWF